MPPLSRSRTAWSWDWGPDPAALMIKALGAKLASGALKDIVGVTTSFQGEVLAAELNIPLLSLNAVDRIDLAIDGADEVDPVFS